MDSKVLTVVYFLTATCFIACHDRSTGVQAGEDDKKLYYYRNLHCYDVVKRCELELLTIENSDTLIYVRSSEFHGEYEEIHGALTAINDSIYFVKTFNHVSQRGNGEKPINVATDTIYFSCDSSLVGTTVWMEYTSGQKEQHRIYSTENVFWINEGLFNKDRDRLYLMLDYKNPIVNENVEIVSRYFNPKYSVSFTAMKDVSNFYVVINDNHIRTLNFGSEGHQSLGPIFRLDRMPQGTQLPKGRKFYD